MNTEILMQLFKGADGIFKLDEFIEDVEKKYYSDYDGRVFVLMPDLTTQEVHCKASVLKEYKDLGVYYVGWYNDPAI